VADPRIKVQFRETSGNNNGGGALVDHGPDRRSYEPPAPRKELLGPLNKVVGEMWPGIPVVLTMLQGASDGRYTNVAGMPTYSVPA
jgi:hypothetical protein